ncbi:hypothetical protein B0T18DRAFT_26734 [Schizothecium vesticola]|uniref:Uncharacterized protein n=1 Tax=Schizothecium vesticola TaxID=314040 RepID=A0AA40FA14_9PEZI|nr:hypothetical protein B0T18DRAFT_26734 [Schizothecium vesticola]
MQRLLCRIQRFQGLADRRRGAHSSWRGSRVGSVEPVPAGPLPTDADEPCCKTGPRPAKTRGWQPAAGPRAHGTNQLHPSLLSAPAARATANRRGIPGSGQQCLCSCACAWLDPRGMMMMTVAPLFW